MSKLEKNGLSKRMNKAITNVVLSTSELTMWDIKPELFSPGEGELVLAAFYNSLKKLYWEIQAEKGMFTITIANKN